jgi:hypothetical protein
MLSSRIAQYEFRLLVLIRLPGSAVSLLLGYMGIMDVRPVGDRR